MSPKSRSRLKWIPTGVKQSLRALLLRVAAAWARRQIRLSPDGIPSRSALRALWLGWGNTGWSADTEYLRAVAGAALRVGVVLECGSGLTTVLLALLAERHPIRTLSLEHQRPWLKRVGNRLTALGLDASGLRHSPLRDYGDYAWYTRPSETEDRFQMVICDGPPGDTPGGRYGLLPVMADQLAPGAIIFLDDVTRDGEQAALRRWQEEFAVSVETGGSLNQFAKVCFSGAESNSSAPDR